MENASKALIMAGSILISIMLVTFMILMLRKGGKISSEYDSQASSDELASFNSDFEVYSGKNNTILDIITVSNLAWDINKKNNFDEQNSVYVTVVIKKGNLKGEYTITPNPDLKKNYFNEGYMYDLAREYGQTEEDADGTLAYKYTFECTGIEYNQITGKVKSISFENN